MSTPVGLIEEIVERGGDADDTLRTAISALAAEPDVVWAGIAFVDGGALDLGPSSGQADASRRQRVPIVYEGSLVGELWLDGAVPPADLERIATLLAPLVLIGWDTGGEAWEP